PFSRIRKFGAVGFAVGVFAAGILSEHMGIGIIFYLYSASFFLCVVLLFSMPKGSVSRQSENGHRARGGYKRIFKEKRLVQLILCIFFVGGTNVANNTYFSFLYLEAGGSLAGVGLVMLFMVGSEAPFMQWSAKLAEAFTLEKTIAGAIIISIVRFLVYSCVPPSFVIAALFFLQGAVNGIILVEFVRYVRKLAPKGCEGLAVSIYYALGSSGSTIVCQLIGGTALDVFGPGGVYLFFAIFNLIGLVLYFAFGMHKEAL
ncbi:MAG: MFS transporter, partial [Firmicutes bacterium]|nr:MFS transporter [Bacillota bacterium]